MASQNSLPLENGFNVKQDVESSPIESKELRKKKRIKCFAYIIAFVVFQTGIIALFSLTIMKIRTPKFRVKSADFESFNIGTATNSSFDMRMNAQLSIKNTNFGGFKYQNTPVNFYYNEALVGVASVSNSKVGWRTTKNINVLVNISSNSVPANSQLGSDLDYGFLTLNTRAKLDGKVELLQFLFKKKKTINLDCYITIYLAGKVVNQISCH